MLKIGSLRRKLRTVWRLLRTGNVVQLTRRTAATLSRLTPASYELDYEGWYARFAVPRDTIDSSPSFVSARPVPLLSIVLPAADHDPDLLRGLIASLEHQRFRDWELLLYHGESANPGSGAHKFASDRVHPIEILSCQEDQESIPWRVLEDAAADLVVFVAQTDRLHSDALDAIFGTATDDPDLEVIFTDHDHVAQDGLHFEPIFKPSWNPDLILGQGLLNHVLAVSRSLLNRLLVPNESVRSLAAGIALSVSAERTHRLSFPYCSITAAGSVSEATISDQVELQNRLFPEGRGMVDLPTPGRQSLRIKWPLPAPPPRVSILIPTRNRGRMLQRCVTGLWQQTDYSDIEVILVDHESTQRRARRFLDVAESNANTKVIRYAGPFNFAALANRAVEASSGEMLCLLNNDVEIIHEDWLQELVRHLCRPDVGVVGALLLFKDQTIQHAGIHPGLDGLMGHGHKHRPFGDPGYAERLLVAHEVAAVTGACLGISRSTWDDLGGMDELNLPVAYNDVDLCLKARERGLRVIFTPHSRLIHQESASRGPDEALEHNERLRRELAVMQDRWKDLLYEDPAYSPNLSLDGGGFELEPEPRRDQSQRNH